MNREVRIISYETSMLIYSSMFAGAVFHMIEDDDWSVEVVYLPRFDDDKTESDNDDKNIEIDNDESESNMDEDFYFESQEKVEKEPEVIKEETLSTVLIQHTEGDHDEDIDWTTSTREDEQAFDEAEIETIPEFYEQRFVTRGSNDHSYLRKLVE